MVIACPHALGLVVPLVVSPGFLREQNITMAVGALYA